MAMAGLAFGKERIAAVLKILRSGIERNLVVSGGAWDRIISHHAGGSSLKPGRLVRGTKTTVNQKCRTGYNYDHEEQQREHERFPGFHLASGTPWTMERF
jgi:hypothetical protein